MNQLLDGPLLQLRVTAQFYLENKGKYILEVWEHGNPKDVKRRVRGRNRERQRKRKSKREREPPPHPGPLFPLLYLFFLLPLGLLYVNWASQECCLFYLRSWLQSLDLPLFYFCGLFPFLVFEPPPFWTPFPYSNYLTFLPKEMRGPFLWE